MDVSGEGFGCLNFIAPKLTPWTTSDEEILRIARQENRILITRDRDYGHLVFVRAVETGVIYLRVLPTIVHAVHGELARIINHYSEAELSRAFVVVEVDGHRFRKPFL